jgi:hypothetical protein
MRAADYFAIQNLVFRYARCLDRGDYAGVGRLFAHAELYAQGRLVARSNPELVAETWRNHTYLYENGTPRTRHVVTNLIIEADGEERARAESYVMVIQQTRTLPLQPVIAGDYFDRFAKVDGQWRFTERRIGTELFGNLGEHLKVRMTVPETYQRPQEW